MTMSGKIGVVGIQSNDTEQYPADSFEKMKQEVDQSEVTRFLTCWMQNRKLRRLTPPLARLIFSYSMETTLWSIEDDFDETRPTRIKSGVYDSTANAPNGRRNSRRNRCGIGGTEACR